MFWRDLPISRKALIVVAIPVFPLIATAVLYVRSTGEHLAARDAAERAWENLATQQELHALVFEAESAVRGFVISGSPDLLARYRSVSDRIGRHLDTLEARIEDRGQRQRLPSIRELATARLAALEAMVASTTSSGRTPPELAAHVERGALLMNRLDMLLDDTANDQLRVLSARAERVVAARARSTAIVLAGTSAGVLGGFAAAWLFTTGISRRLQQATNNVTRLSAGEPLVPSTPAGDEIGRLTGGMELAATLLNERDAQLQARMRELTEANRALAAARRDADRANRAKSDFISRMSHDLRTPLTAIMGFAEVLQLDPLTPEQVESVTHIRRGGQHLLNLINEVLDISLIEAGRLTLSPEPVALPRLLDAAVGLIQPLADRRRIQITVDAPPRIAVIADQQRLNEVLLNLLSNAVKYNRPGGAVWLRARVESHAVTLDVIDTGIGIPPDKLARLFTPFERLGAETSSIEGTGLGLTLAKRLTEAMNGTLSVEGSTPEGTTFRLTLPEADAEPAIETAEATTPQIQPVKGTVVYVEDNASNVQLMRRILERRPGATLRHAPDGQTALEMIRAEAPDLVILDLHLSDMSGEKVLQQLRADPQTRSIPVAVLSGEAGSATQRRLLDAGAFCYLTKPFAIRGILKVVDDVLGPAA